MTAAPLGWASSGALADIGTHHVDLLRMMLGEVARGVWVLRPQARFGTDDADTAVLRFESDALAALTASINVWKAQS